MKRFNDWLQRPFVGPSLAVSLAFLWSSALWYSRPENLCNEDFVIFEQGHNLMLADAILAGQRLYRDIFSQYGPLPIYLHAAWAAVFGNTAHSYLALVEGLTLVNAALLYQVLRRSVPAPAALLWLVAAVFPFLVLPGSLAAGQLYALYPGCERALLLLVALAWVDPRGRSPRRAALLGGLLGAMQLVKFGGAFMAGGALVLTDLLILGRGLANRAIWRSWRVTLGYILAGFLAVELPWAAVALLTLPAALAADVLWPAYMLKNYASYAAIAPRYGHWAGLRYFAEEQLPAAIAAALNAGLIWRVVTRRRGEAAAGDGADPQTREGPLVFFACYFPLALAFYLPHVWVATMSVWIFIAAGAYIFYELPTLVRGGVLLGLLPCFYVSIHFVLPAKAGGNSAEKITMPNGEALWLRRGWKACFARTQETLDRLAGQRTTAEAAPPPGLMIFPIGSGYFHYFPSRHFTRHTWLINGFVRPDEQAALVDSLADTTAVVVFSQTEDASPIPANPAAWKMGLNPGFAPAINEGFARRLGEPIRIDDHCTIIPVKR